jgi:hypothetical protein
MSETDAESVYETGKTARAVLVSEAVTVSAYAAGNTARADSVELAVADSEAAAPNVDAETATTSETVKASDCDAGKIANAATNADAAADSSTLTS